MRRYRLFHTGKVGIFLQDFPYTPFGILLFPRGLKQISSAFLFSVCSVKRQCLFKRSRKGDQPVFPPFSLVNTYFSMSIQTNKRRLYDIILQREEQMSL